MRTLAGCTIAGAVCLAVPRAEAQTTNEALLWMELGFTYEPTRSLRISVDEHFRFDQNLSRAQAIMTEAGLRYAPLRWLRFAVGYRFAFETDNDDVARVRHRMHVDASTRHRFRPLILGFRFRFQEEARSEDDNGEPWRETLRARTSLELRRVPLDPELTIELFLRRPDADSQIGVRKLRTTLGVTLGTAGGDVSLAYRLETVFAEDEIRHIILLGWRYDIED